MKVKAIAVSLMAVVFSMGANAAETAGGTQMHELLFNATSGALNFGGGTTSIGIRGGYNYTLMPGLQVGINPNFSWNSVGGVSTTSFGFLAGPTVNFPMEEKWDDALFLMGGVGIQNTAGATSFQFGGELGKRFKIMEGLTYRPSFAVTVANSAATFAVNVLSFSAVL